VTLPSTDIPPVASLLDVRNHIGSILDAMDSGAGPAILGRRGAPDAVLVTFDLFDRLRDELGEREARDHLALAHDRTTHPAGPATTTLGVLTGTSCDQPVTWWPELVTDLRGQITDDLADVLVQVVDGRLVGTPLGPWRWFLALATPCDAPAHGWHVIWRPAPLELAAAVPVSDLLAQAWTTGPPL